jgi:hypothetical protein
MQPRLCHVPIASDRRAGNGENFRNFFQTQAAEVTQLVDFIDVNGEITEGIATGTFTGQRMKVREL